MSSGFDKYIRKRIPENWKSLVTGNLFAYKGYSTHETEKSFGPASGLKCLPVDEYPYTLTFKDLIPAWKRMKDYICNNCKHTFNNPKESGEEWNENSSCPKCESDNYQPTIIIIKPTRQQSPDIDMRSGFDVDVNN